MMVWHHSVYNGWRSPFIHQLDATLMIIIIMIFLSLLWFPCKACSVIPGVEWIEIVLYAVVWNGDSKQKQTKPLLLIITQWCYFSGISSCGDDFVGLVVKASDLRAEDPGWGFSGSSHTSDFKIDTPVATLPSTWQKKGQWWDWLAQCQYTVSGWGRKKGSVMGLVGLVSIYCKWVR